MRRLLTALSLAGFMGLMTGCCWHVAGVCDCDYPGHRCCMPCGWHHLAPGAYLAPKPEPKSEPIPKPEEAPKAEKAPEKVDEAPKE
ncbi:hypothetical protein AYO44_01315 [Planctomycetaceae bacterium SCGC AG-212-F19]|nr:hypothetical protein AYO44_01315 [Planctomycetaceae bacterium SCGC AG-212-F19]